MKKSLKTVKFGSWKFHLQKLKMGQCLGQYDFAILFRILTPSTSIWFHIIINYLTNWFLGQNFIQSVKFVFKNFIFENGTGFGNTTFRFNMYMYYSADKYDRGFYTFYTIIPPFTIYPNLLFTPIYYLPPFTIYPHLLFTPIHYLPPFTVYPHLLFTPIYCLPPFTVYPHLLFTPIYYLPPFTIYPNLLFTPIYYLPPFTIYPHLLLYYFSGITTHRKSFRRFIFSSKHSHSNMTGIRNSYVVILKKFA